MKYTVETVIQLPRNRVIELFDNPDNLSKWQEGLQRFEHLSGEAGQPGAKSRLLYDMSGRQVEMIETIVTRNLPEEFTAIFEASGVRNYNAKYFHKEGPETTRWVQETEFQFSGFMRLMSIFMGGTFRKQTEAMMHAFKDFAEQEG